MLLRQNVHALRTTVGDVVAGLRELEKDFITKARTLDYLTEVQLRAEALAPYTFWSEKQYTRNLLYRDDNFEMLVLCWLPGQKTPIHTHNGQLGWMAVIQGEVAVHHYRYLRCSSPENQNVIGIDCLAGGKNVELETLQSVEGFADGPILTVDKVQTIHQIENRDTAKAGCITLHLYSRPIDSCVAFDLRSRRCGRRSLKYHSVEGKLLRTEDPHQGLSVVP
jgi:cysteine dioxygenase